IPDRLAQDLRTRLVAERPEERFVAIEDLAVDRRPQHPGEIALEQLAIALLGVPVLGDVGENAVEVERAAVGGRARADAVAHPALAAVGQEQAIFELAGPAGAKLDERAVPARSVLG